MRRLIAGVVLLSFVLLAPAGCRRRKKKVQPPTEGGLLSVVNVADPAASSQLLRGFYSVESESWRWTSSKFAVLLQPPEPGTDRGAKLELKFTIPEAIFKKLGPMTVTATVNGVALAPETFSQAGDFTYARGVPGRALGPVTAEFSVDKALPPGETDQRELALIVTNIGLTAQ